MNNFAEFVSASLRTVWPKIVIEDQEFNTLDTEKATDFIVVSGGNEYLPTGCHFGSRVLQPKNIIYAPNVTFRWIRHTEGKSLEQRIEEAEITKIGKRLEDKDSVYKYFYGFWALPETGGLGVIKYWSVFTPNLSNPTEHKQNQGFGPHKPGSEFCVYNLTDMDDRYTNEHLQKLLDERKTNEIQ